MPRFQVMAGPKLERLTEESSVVQSGIRHQLQLKLLTAKTNNITTDHLATSPGLGFTIHSDLPVPNEEFRFAAASSQSLELQDFRAQQAPCLFQLCASVAPGCVLAQAEKKAPDDHPTHSLWVTHPGNPYISGRWWALQDLGPALGNVHCR